MTSWVSRTGAEGLTGLVLHSCCVPLACWLAPSRPPLSFSTETYWRQELQGKVPKSPRPRPTPPRQAPAAEGGPAPGDSLELEGNR